MLDKDAATNEEQKAKGINWGKVERTILNATSSLLLLLVCAQVVVIKVQNFVTSISNAPHS